MSDIHLGDWGSLSAHCYRDVSVPGHAGLHRHSVEIKVIQLVVDTGMTPVLVSSFTEAFIHRLRLFGTQGFA